jgi:hypothetical protein
MAEATVQFTRYFDGYHEEPVSLVYEDEDLALEEYEDLVAEERLNVMTTDDERLTYFKLETLGYTVRDTVSNLPGLGEHIKYDREGNVQEEW